MPVAEMKIKAIAPWFGGKRKLAPEIVALLGKHTQYFEPFCGSMAVLLAKEPSQKETVNDLHGDLVNLARVLQATNAAETLYDKLQRTLLSEDLLEQARIQLGNVGELFLEDLDHIKPQNAACIDRAYWYFLASWMGRNGTAGSARVDYQIAVRWTKSGGSPTVRWRNAVDSIPAWHERLRNVVILKRDAFRILDRFEDVPETAIYADPPYVSDSRSGFRFGSGSDHKYLHEFSHKHAREGLFGHDGDDHDRLRSVLGRYRKARVIVSYYDCPRIRELWDGWNFHEHTMQKILHAQNGSGAAPKTAPELLITNF